MGESPFMNTAELLTKIARCHAEVAQCQRAAADESLPLHERVGAQAGECDWLVELAVLQEEGLGLA